jgi:hypothetical protein
MPLDMTGDHKYNRDVHYRRYLSLRDHRITVICVQDFDYRDYEPSRFIDLQAFDSDEEARLTPLTAQDVAHEMRTLPEDDDLGFMQGNRILRALNRELLYGSM